MIKYNNLDSIDEDEIKTFFDTINFECDVEISKLFIGKTPYYTLKFGELKKIFKISDFKNNLEMLRKLHSKLGTLIYVNSPSNLSGTNSNTKKIESITEITQV
jgi:aspartate/methionine/tyrosine aminotransferase